MSGDNYFITDQNAVYFLTFTVVEWVDVFTRKEYKIQIVDSLNYCIDNKGLEVFSWCLMSNHLHIVCRAGNGYKLSDIIRDFKKFTAKAIINLVIEGPESRKDWLLYRFQYAAKFNNKNITYKFWQDTNHAILLDSNYLIDQKIEYIHNNPVKALIVSKAEDYLFSSARDYSGEKGYVKISGEL